MTLEYETPKHPIGTQFKHRKGTKGERDAEIIGYLIVHESDTGYTNVTYRIKYDFAGQTMKQSVTRSAVDRALL